MYLNTQLSGAYLPYHLRAPFNTLPEEVENAVLAVIGDEFLMPKAPRCLYHSQVLSIFLSNTFDMIPDYRILMQVAAKCSQGLMFFVKQLRGIVSEALKLALLATFVKQEILVCFAI